MTRREVIAGGGSDQISPSKIRDEELRKYLATDLTDQHGFNENAKMRR